MRQWRSVSVWPPELIPVIISSNPSNSISLPRRSTISILPNRHRRNNTINSNSPSTSSNRFRFSRSTNNSSKCRSNSSITNNRLNTVFPSTTGSPSRC